MYPNNVEKTLKKYTKPQLLAMEKVMKQGCLCVLLAFPFFVLANYTDYLAGDIESLTKLIGVSLMYSVFFIFIPFAVIKGNFVGYKIYRRQILEEEEPPTETFEAGEGAATSEINQLKRTVEDLAVEVALLQQQIQTSNQSHWQAKDTKK